ncbi:sigma-54-dependent Fis family transcriptional regulator [Skermanella aerolata]|uniref:Sigma-54-dependent Fis family transcriptional regulator n=1 Tax=Skermanella aerolata TaxID=393310 RepID=A0A512DZR0_9PROT|nr:sigma-54-dependent Fis family transcriptional regulator [Skermanella aerolata]KJB91975.1 ATPase AAA [Skermanella aerolata KACC 11604]GEO41925.1 sigma-54-dependent Fis family transcriptional regulator [Skermanella aerolata]
MGSITRPATLTPEIRQSWERCLEAGLDPHRPPEPVYADAATVREARDRHELTRRLALAEMHNLYHQISGSNFMIALGDPGGMVLDTITDDTFRTTAEAKNIRAGGLWGELQQGTNALGLASAMKAPVTVHGPEHFFRMYDGLTCNAAPIFGPSGEIAGILDASSDCRSRQRHTMALVKMSVRQIENGLFRDLHRNDLVLIFHTRAEYLRTLSAGLLAVDPTGTIIAASAQAAFFLQGLPARPGHHFAELFRTGFLDFLDESHRRDRVRLEDHEGSSYVVAIDNLHKVCPLHRHQEPKPKSQPRPAPRTPSPDFIAEDPAVTALLTQVAGATARGVPILIRGPTGTGKELMARHAHAVSGRTGAFVPVNCAALPDTLIEAELFGYAEGAFTGARRGGAKGLVNEADGGTLFLDEIGDMPVQLQSILLRLLDDWTIRPVGSSARRTVDVQLVAATNANLEEAVQTGRFRADLLYRLNTIEITLPPLAERKDFHRIARHLLHIIDPAASIADTALALLAQRPWPGNVRELRSVLTRLAITADRSVIGAEHLNAPAPPPAPAPASTLERAVIDQVVATWEQSGRNITETARRLGVTRNTVYKKLRTMSNYVKSGPRGGIDD